MGDQGDKTAADNAQKQHKATVDNAEGQLPRLRPPGDAKKMSFCLLLLMLRVGWLVQTGIISYDGVMTADVRIPLAESGFPNRTNNLD